MAQFAVTSSAPSPPYIFCSPEGHILCRQIISKRLGIDPHDYQLDGVCNALDGRDLLAVTPTGSGKTGFLYMYLLVMHAIMDDSSLCVNPPRHFRKGASMVVVCPTKALEVDMEPKFRPAGLKTLVVNEDTVGAARLCGSNIWDHASDVHVLLLGPEQLTAKGFEKVLRNKEYQKRIVALAVDEVHLLTTWGLSFRKCFTHIGTARMRFDNSPILIALTATLRTGEPFLSVCKFLGLHESYYHLIRRSNQRHDLQFLFRSVRSGARAFRFPELNWILLEKRRVIVFCRTIATTFRVAMYLRTLAEAMASELGTVDAGDLEERVRTYTALNWESYNSVTLELMHTGTRRSWVTVATDTLSVGIDVANTEDVVIYDFRLPPDTDGILQKAGRIRDGRGKNSKVVIYLPKTAMETCAKALTMASESGAPETVVKTGKGKQSIPVDIGVAKLVRASCKVDALDQLYDNPLEDPPCTCRTCTAIPPILRPQTCRCSGCKPEPIVAPPTKAKLPRAKVPAAQRITKKMRDHARDLLHKYRKSQRDATEDWDMLPAEEILPDEIIAALLDRFYEVIDIPSLTLIATDHEPLSQRYRTLWPIVIQLRTDFEAMRTKAKLDQAAKRRATAARKQAELLRVGTSAAARQAHDAAQGGGIGAGSGTEAVRGVIGVNVAEGVDEDDSGMMPSDGDEDSDAGSNTEEESDVEVEGDDEAEVESGIQPRGARTLRYTIVIPARTVTTVAPTIRIPPRPRLTTK